MVTQSEVGDAVAARRLIELAVFTPSVCPGVELHVKPGSGSVQDQILYCVPSLF